MKILIVLAHPETQSFNAAMFRKAIETLRIEGHEVKTSDLYRMNFNPVSDRHNFTTVKDSSFLKLQLEEMHATEAGSFSPELRTEQEKVEWCNLMIWQFPLWWFALPSILKGWADRVFAMGKAYSNGNLYEQGLFKGKKALLSVTTGSPEKAFLKDGLQGDINAILRPIHRGIFEFTGFSVLRPQLSYAVARQTAEERSAELEKWSKRLKSILHEEKINVGVY
ncbi:NAD(P)H-dependent oxidoreductase [Olivibacter sp. SDN3]|uniref:NAD(P)H-dependent oxidoreductase n=1 Tax=Olivibacter sp. SDN3 TaxID=2764720 RepID=UPI00165123C1|nr:NAD(P)H-dependent oxidoreductase [Olivibacter sp. SDN3]QNL51063.1 NAD(P)H-dependent oxidoreductase [Olivibacter sp. SDN3]